MRAFDNIPAYKDALAQPHLSLDAREANVHVVAHACAGPSKPISKCVVCRAAIMSRKLYILEDTNLPKWLPTWLKVCLTTS